MKLKNLFFKTDEQLQREADLRTAKLAKIEIIDYEVHDWTWYLKKMFVKPEFSKESIKKSVKKNNPTFFDYMYDECWIIANIVVVMKPEKKRTDFLVTKRDAYLRYYSNTFGRIPAAESEKIFIALSNL